MSGIMPGMAEEIPLQGLASKHAARVHATIAGISSTYGELLESLHQENALLRLRLADAEKAKATSATSLAQAIAAKLRAENELESARALLASFQAATDEAKETPRRSEKK